MQRLSAADLIRQACSESLTALKRHRVGVLKLEAEPIHQMRIGTRKLGAILKVFTDLMEQQWATELETELRWLAHLLGTVRDLDVLRDRLRTAAKDVSHGGGLTPAQRRSLGQLQRILGTRHRDAQAALIEGIESERYTMLVHCLHMGSLAPQLQLEAGEPALATLAPHLSEAWKKLSRSASRLKQSDDALTYHRVRKMSKRIRYSAEALASELHVTQRKDADRFILQMKKLQNLLGELQDAHVAIETIIQVAESTSGLRIHRDLQVGLRHLLKSQRSAETNARRKFGKRWNAASNRVLRKWMQV